MFMSSELLYVSKYENSNKYMSLTETKPKVHVQIQSRVYDSKLVFCLHIMCVYIYVGY